MSESIAMLFELKYTTVKKNRIIVIDDDKACQRELNQALKDAYEVLCFNSSSEAIQRAEAERPFAIILNIHMPNIDGYEVLNLLRNHPSTCSTPIICMSESDSEEMRTRAESHGATGFIHKPFKSFSLSSDITTLIQSLNKTIFSRDEKRSFTITYNDSERTRLIRQLIDEELNSEDTLVVISLTQGKDFFDGEIPSYIQNEKLIFLEINPQLIIKFPFLMEVSSVTHDLMNFLPPSRGNYHLVFDEVRSILNLSDSERTLAKTYALSHALRAIFNRISFFTTQPTHNVNTLLLQKMARIFTEG